MSKENIFEGWDKQTIKKYQHWQLRTIIVSMIGYAIYYFVRKNFSIAMPGLTAQSAGKFADGTFEQSLQVKRFRKFV